MSPTTARAWCTAGRSTSRPHSILKVKPIEGGPVGLISALHSALGPQGTLVMPSMSYEETTCRSTRLKSLCATGSHCRYLLASAWRPAQRQQPRLRGGWSTGGADNGSTPLLISHTGWTARSAGPTNWTGECYCWASTTARRRHLCENMAGVRYRRKIPHDPEGWGAGPL